jgi:outer membrane protein OmpA-like peptidoglycan-associated protein
MTRSKPLLLATAAILAFAGAHSAASAGAKHPIKLAQAAQPANSDHDKAEKDKKKEKKNEHKPPEKQAQPAAKPAPHPRPKAAEKPPQAAQPKAAAKQPEPKHKPSKSAEKPPRHAQPKAAEKPPQPAQPKAAEKQHEQPKAAEKSVPPKQEQPKSAEKPPQHEKPKAAETPTQPQQPKAAEKPPQQPQSKSAEKPAQPQQTQPKSAEKPAEPQRVQPKAAQQPTQQQQARQPTTPTAAPPPPQKTRSADEFIRRKGEAPARSLADLHKERRETREGNRVIIHEGDRTIVRKDNRVIIRHSEAQRFAVGARNVRVEHRGGRTVTVIERPNGVRIITITDADGHLIRRLRRDPNGREIVIVDESFAGPRRDIFVDLRPPTIRIPRDRYIVDLDRARPQRIYDVLTAPPIDRIERRYTIAQVRYNAPLRDYMPRVDLDIHFDTGSWQLTLDQIDKLAVIAQQLNRVIDRNPRELFLIEGHTDAVGSQEDNLSLSDRRAEAVAVALTEQFRVPPENLVTQGYGEQELKVETQGPERANRRVAVRRITPLVARAESEGRR